MFKANQLNLPLLALINKLSGIGASDSTHESFRIMGSKMSSYQTLYLHHSEK